MARIRKVMMASDFSSASRAAFARAVALAEANRASLVLVHAMLPPPTTLGGEYVSPQSWERIETANRATAQKELATLAAKARRAGVRAISLIVSGPPHEAIVRAARSKRVDLLVVGTHGRTGLGRFFLGSVAARVVASASCPVLTVRGG
jgi:universal stress protein A